MEKKEQTIEIESVREDLIDLLIFKNQTEVAKAVGVSTAAISQFAADKYKGDNKRLAAKLRGYMNTAAERAKYANQPQYVKTTVAVRIERLIERCVSFSGVEGKIGVITGDGGHGKSHCAREYAACHQSCVYVLLDDCMHTKAIFAAIAKEVGSITAGNLGKITEGLVEVLRDREAVVVLDEASSLNVGQLNKLRQIIAVRSKTPLVLIGNKDITRTLAQPTTRYGYEALDQFTSRMMGSVDLDAIAAAEGIYDETDIRSLFEYAGKVLTDDAVDTLVRLCQTHRSGRLRICSHVIAALHTSSSVGAEITCELIVAAIEQLGLPVRPFLPLAEILAKQEKRAKLQAAERRVAV